MQVFLPFADYAETASVLDMKRLGKQRVETYQLMLGLFNIKPDGTPKDTKRSWGDHVVARIWSGHLASLLEYQRATCSEWTGRGYKDTCLEKTELTYERGVALGYEDLGGPPAWLGDERVHSSHRAALLWKAPDFYSRYGWEERPAYDYYWPTTESP